MDLRNLIHHQNHNQSHHQPRYVPMPYPSPQSTTHYPDDPNFHNPRPQNPNHHYHQTYHHHQIHHHNVLQPQPQVTPHLAPTPMPRPISPQYNPNQPLFTVPPPNQNLPFEFERIQRPCHWVSHRIPIDDDRLGSRLPDFDHACSGNRSDIKDASRAMVVSRQEWSYDFDSDTRFHFQNKTMSPYGVTDRFRHDAVGSSRFKREYNVGFESKRREEMRVADEENHARKGQCVLSSDACFRDPELVSDSSSSVRNLELKSGSYSGHYCVAYEDELYKRGGRDEMNENARWSHDTKSPRDVHSSSSFEKGCAVVSNGDWAHIVTSKRQYYGSKPGGYGNSGSREVNHEFIWNPRKQVQKKSALLRIQKPNHKNTDSSEQSYYSSYVDNSNSSSFRHKDQRPYSGHGMNETSREVSNVELDVSFKSNSLVAKAIMAPSNSSDVNDAELTFRNRKARKDSLTAKDSANAEHTKLVDSTIRHVIHNTSTSDKDSILSEGKDTSGKQNISDVSSKACMSGTSCLLGNNKKENMSDDSTFGKDGTEASSGILFSGTVAKKKNIAKKFVKPAIMCNTQATKKDNELIMAENCSIDPSAASNEQIQKKEERSVITTESKECGIDVDSHVEYVSKINEDGNSSNFHLGSPSRQEKCIINIDSENADNPDQNMQNAHNIKKDLTEPLNATTFADDGCIIDAKQSCQSGDSLLLESGSRKESLEVMIPVRGNIDSCMVNSEEMKVHKGLIIKHSSESCVDDTFGIINGLISSKEETTNCNVDAVTALSNQSCGIQITLSHQDDFSKELFEATYMAGRNATVGLSSLRETLKGADYSIQGGGSFWSSDNVYSNNREVIVISNSMVLDCIEPSLGGATTLPENGAKQRSLNVTNSVEEYEGISCTKMKKSTALEFSRVFATDIESKDITNSAASVGTTLDISFKEPNNEAVSCFRSLDVDLKGPCHSKDGTGALHENSSLDGCFEGNALVRNDFDNGSGANPSQSRKRRRVSALDPSLYSLATSQTNKESAISYTSTLEEPLNANDASSYIKKEVNIFRTNGNNRGTVLAENKLAEGFSDALNAVSRSTSSDDNLEFEPHGVGSISTHDVLTTSLPLFSSGPGSEQRTDGTQVTFVDNRQVGILNVECSRKNNFGVSAPIEQDVIHGETTECLVHSDLQPPNVDVGMEHNNLLEKDNLSHLSNYLSLPASCEGVSSTTTNEKKEFEPNMIPKMGTSQASFNALDVHMLDAKALLCQMSTELCRNDEKLDEKSVVEVRSKKPFSRSTEANLKSDHAVTSDHSTFRTTVALPLQGSKGASHSLNIRSAEYIGLQKNQLACIIPRTFTSCPAFVFTEKTPSVHAKPRTWHRDGNFSSPFPHTGSKLPSSLTSLRHIPKKDRKCQTNSYVRKGNSLVRNSPDAALHPGYDGSTSVKLLNSTRVDEMKRSTGSDNRVDACTKLSSSSALLSVDFMSSLSAERLVSGYCGSFPDSTRFSENNDTFKFAEVSLEASESVKTLNEQLNCSDSHTELNDANLASSDTKRIVYVKRKSNQLVATSDSHDISLANAEKMQASSFDGYYKKRKNQLIRTSLESLNKQIVIVPNDNTKFEVQKATSDRRGSRTQLEIVPPKLGKPATKTLVWTLRGTKSSANDHSSLRHQRVFPRLFPWKRTTFWKNFTQYRNLISETTSLSPITRKLLLLRKRDTIYIRSTNGYSLRKSKVLSVGGSSLKWSKSIEKRAKQANEEATLAVAAAKRKKREKNGVAFAGSGLKNRKLSSRERIFRIGSDRYKMDPSRRTLQRISDNESSDSASVQTDKVARRSYIPRRLVIGNDEYVQVGNGNQLIRDPKRRTRLLASEKVRWSLHTVRLRLARKRKYCQFFTRFGKCNKDDGKCPYIHDPSKIAVCTKYLNSLCSNPNCKLTHKVIPERMPDCSYFLQGLCTNESCPYRHVNVNPKASICEGFLRGYCADGNECRKKHSYVCPTFQATRTCSQGSKCKLHHPMNRTGGKIRKRYIEPKNTRGRYFGSMRTNIAGSRTSASDRQSSEDRSERCLEEEGADFISIDLDVSDDEEGESKDLMGKQTLVLESDPSKLQLDDLDELIKPARIMH